MYFLYAIILAIVQAVTEFWPVSSSGHLVILHQILPLNQINALSFDIALHLGTVLALIIFFRQDLKKYFLAFLQMFRSFNLGNDEQKTVLNLLVATVPAVLAGYFLDYYIELYFRSLLVVSISLIVGAIIIFIVEKWSRKTASFEGLSIPEAIIIGCAQALALIPGVSRSGSTIITGMVLKLKRSEAAKFSFLLSIPIVLGAGIKKMLDISIFTLEKTEQYLFLVGFLTAFIVGYLIIKYFLKFLEKHSLSVFAWYRIILGIVILLIALL
ncbi:undecaprenyl-diphosphatase UppP [Candidatus Falkowbacteria bacterium RIFOXYD2_FULL_35_9]|uniref:Undecaprenyl-diphosphatase n=1 Tax=Candidatus Falkowbacteria bacterium RIFOXYC2_FULL_36_12 TaxID=1798002 RepID=A0A1F5SY66_9BACT|nr:MAG: undecaprenyl-diphosphatase UppP [Candidatus Falkowbacteria bacterium RIFOXYC2_FULL_36_12]OGF32004.1 MAG: undecaprenyl-diphosphatase UppP [Candidatus Falkowbacteria bacterium RIFOXYB2_FULL_35_7]OGF34040.1 MAG: undecaprenyl-diphosphatase UppP [Candidatus Falkowbacteria bacterium RIFOXYA2_FULL_35_8]OGF45943.1 MAG: undecaprenyl-diphosphatase UppP [Candidatus Falkowbacteria bacterium RIFOXYD2_FULL_35_9]